MGTAAMAFDRQRFDYQLQNHIADDEKQEFVQLLRSQFDAAIKDCDNSELLLSNYLLRHINLNEAINCATALLKGDTGLTLKLEEPQLWSLHGAADALSPKMTKFFLESGVPATAKISLPGTDNDGSLPIDFAVCSARRRVSWTKEESLYSLIVELTGERMIKPMETIRSLINVMPEVKVTEIIWHYAAQAKIIELASLFISCSERSIIVDKLYYSSNFVSERDRMTLRQYIANMIVVLENKVRKLVDADSYKLAEYREMKESMMSILMLLEIVLRTSNGIAWMARRSDHSYSTMCEAIGQMFEISGFKADVGDFSYHESHPIVKHFFPSGAPQLGSLQTMPDFGCDDTDLNHPKVVPMPMALKELRYIHWTSNESIFKLIIILCLPGVKEILDAARSFAEKSRKINEIACCYAMDSKLIELAIILMVAKKKVMDPIKFRIKGDKSKRSMTFQHFINSELAQAMDLECRLVGRLTEEEKELSDFCKRRKLAMLSALTLLEIFEKAGPHLGDYIWSEKKNVQKEQVIKDVSKLLSEAGFRLTSKDTEISDTVDNSFKVALEQQYESIEDPNNRLSTSQDINKDAEMSTGIGSQSQDVRRLCYVLPCGFVESNATYGKPNDMRKFLFTRYPKECKSLSSGAQSFRAFWTSNARSRYSAGFPKALEVQQGPVTKFMQNFPVSKQFTTVALAIKRLVKYA